MPSRFPLVTAFAAWLVVYEPLAYALTASAALGRLTLYGLPAFGLLAFRAGVTALGVAAGLALWRREGYAPRLARWWVVGHALALVVTFGTPYFPSNRLPRLKPVTLAAQLTFAVGCWSWLRWSRRLREACDGEILHDGLSARDRRR